MNIINKKTLISLIVLIILAGFSVWFYQYQQTTNQRVQEAKQKINNQSEEAKTQQPTVTTTTAISALKTYRNEEWGFEFQYPENWKTKEDSFYSPFSKFNLIMVPVEGKYLPDPIFVNIVTPDFAEQTARNLGKSVVEIKVAGVFGPKYEYEYESLHEIGIILPFGEYRMLLGSKKQYEDIFNQILTSFKFIK